MACPSPFVPLADVADEARFGGKAAQLGEAIRAGLPVPPGFALSHERALALEAGGAARPGRELERGLDGELERVLGLLGRSVAVRSSAVGEDSATASFAGQHATVLGVASAAGLREAVRVVVESGRAPSALEYRRKLGVEGPPRMGVVVQKLVHAEVAGVLFTRHPVSGADERVVEATWGLGEAVVQGLVTPDGARIARGGRLLEYAIGEKDLAVRWTAGGGTEEVPVEGPRVHERCLSDAMLEALEALATRCEATFGGTQDLEFAFEGGALYLLQRRAITSAARPK